MAILLIFRNIGYHFKDTFNFGIFLQLTLIIIIWWDYFLIRIWGLFKGIWVGGERIHSEKIGETN